MSFDLFLKVGENFVWQDQVIFFVLVISQTSIKNFNYKDSKFVFIFSLASAVVDLLLVNFNTGNMSWTRVATNGLYY